MKTKIVALLLALIFIFTCGCGKDKDSDDTALSEDEQNPVLFTANGSEITEDFFRYFVFYYKTEIEAAYGEIEDWNSEMVDGKTYWEYVKELALDWFLYAGAVRAQINRLGIEVTEEDKAIVQENWDALCETYGGEEAAVAALEESYCSKAMYMYIVETNVLTELCFEHMYGENGSKVSDEDCADKTAEDGYIMVKHILIATFTTDEEGNTIEFTEEEKSEALKQAESIIALLDQCAPEELEGTFDSVMVSFSDDTGLFVFPDGYLFQEGDMVDEFYNAAVELEEGSYSGIVETDYGYHIILRIPVNYDVIPMAYDSYMDYGYDYYTLRYIVADDMFQANIATWIDRVEIEYTDAYDEIEIDRILAVG